MFQQAFAQIPDINVWYGPDSYMGANIVELFHQISRLPDEEIAEIHPKHDRKSIASLLPRLHYFQVSCYIEKRVIPKHARNFSSLFFLIVFPVLSCP